MSQVNNTLGIPQVIAELRNEANHDLATRGQMERSLSQDMREERDDLKRAAEHAVNAVLDLELDGLIRWVSPSWDLLTGTKSSLVIGKHICEIIMSEHKEIFIDAVESMRKDDSKSRIIRFDVVRQRENAVLKQSDVVNTEEQTDQTPITEKGPEDEEVSLEAQGIMVYDRSTGRESHVRPSIPFTSYQI